MPLMHVITLLLCLHQRLVICSYPIVRLCWGYHIHHFCTVEACGFHEDEAARTKGHGGKCIMQENGESDERTN